MNEYKQSIPNTFFPLCSTQAQLQKAHVLSYKIRQIKLASCFIQNVCQYIFARVWTRSTSETVSWPSITKKRQRQSVRDMTTSSEIKFISPDISWREMESFIKEEAAILVNWQTLMEFACSIILKLSLIFVASQKYPNKSQFVMLFIYLSIYASYYKVNWHFYMTKSVHLTTVWT